MSDSGVITINFDHYLQDDMFVGVRCSLVYIWKNMFVEQAAATCRNMEKHSTAETAPGRSRPYKS